MDAERFPGEAARTSRMLALTLAPAALLAPYTRAPLALLGPPVLALLVRKLAPFAGPSVLPNAVTALRVVLTSALALFMHDPWLQAATVFAIFVIDGLDGLLARRLGASSLQGAHFDMEADGYLVLVVCALLLDRTGVWVLLGGLLRYAFVLATWLVPSRGEAPRSRIARYAFAASLASYLAALLATDALAPALAGLGTLVLCASFGRSFWWSFRGRPAQLYET
ncbi:MAG TPA: CDP-alcohol phosphatidyltransferase family protein [Polyangiales bacterium]